MTRRPTEADCQRTVVDAAHLGGWLVHHARHARHARHADERWSTPVQGDVGFPDLVLARARPPHRLLIVELKRPPNRPTDAQRHWLATLTSAGIDARLVLVPDQLDELVAELTAR